MKKLRIDSFLVEQGLSPSIDKARKEILSGWVKVNGETLRDPSKKISGTENVSVERPGGNFVSRGGDKLLHALKEFDIDLTGLVTLDLGASTGGFTDCMLKSGAAKVYALDVGYNQIDYSLRIDPRVIVMEKIHARDISADMFSERIDFFTADLSFISILKILPSVYKNFLNIRGIILVKPQFEAESIQLTRGVVVKQSDHSEILGRVLSGIIEIGFEIEGMTYSPIKGAAGNIEFLIMVNKNCPNKIYKFDKRCMLSEISQIVETAHIRLQ